MSQQPLPDGSRIGQYEIQQFIARGGMAEVYRAFDTELERLVALKIMLPTLAADAEFVERFRREARTVARLDHPNIVQIFGVGLTPETQRPYIAMQYIEGGSLDGTLEQLSSRGKLLMTEQALAITRQIAEALAAAHNAGIIHRDLKPSNVLIRPDGTPMLVDLGIAVVSDKTKLTQTGGILGTPHYMSPEQVRSQPLDGRSDLYALGVMLYEMLSGVRPFEGENNIAVLHKHAYEAPIPLEKRRPDLPPQVLAIVTKCLHKAPAQRYQRAEEMIQAIDAALQAAGSINTIAQTTAVLTHLRDSALISRQQVVRIPTAEQRRPLLPTWAIITAAVLILGIVGLFVVRSLNPHGTVADVTVTAVSTPTSLAPTATPQAIIVVATPTATPSPPPTETPLPTATATAVPTTAPSPTPAAITFTVSATQPQNQTGILVSPGQTIHIEYISGSWRAGPLPTWPLVGSDGDPQTTFNSNFPIPNAAVVSLIAGVGDASPRLVGQQLTFQSESSGFLWLGANDDNFSDNDGMLTVRITVDVGSNPITRYQPVPLAAQTNATIDLAASPTGSVTLNGVLFDLTRDIFKSQASSAPFDDAPTRLLLFVDIPQPQRLHLLLNAGNGYVKFANQAIGQVLAYCDQSPQLVSDILLSRDIREWHNASNVVSTAVQSQQVYSETITNDVSGYIDLLSLDLPDVCRSGRLTAIEIIDTSIETVNSIDPALNLVGVTVEYQE